MPSISYRRWRTTRARALDEIAEAHAAVGGSARGRRFATQQINRSYTVLLAAHFQGFARDLHSECIDHLLLVIAPQTSLQQLLRTELTRGRHLDRGNAQPGSLGADFRRLGLDLWSALKTLDPLSVRWQRDLELLNEWRNAIVHEDFTSPRLGGIINLRLSSVRRWRTACARLARALDEVMRAHMLRLTGVSPW
jgi:hypothetical protein